MGRRGGGAWGGTSPARGWDSRELGDGSMEGHSVILPVLCMFEIFHDKKLF